MGLQALLRQTKQTTGAKRESETVKILDVKSWSFRHKLNIYFVTGGLEAKALDLEGLCYKDKPCPYGLSGHTDVIKWAPCLGLPSMSQN